MSDEPRLRPGGGLSSRPLHFFWICDCSGSMGTDGKIQSLNNAIQEAIPHMKAVADENPNAQLLLRVLCFSNSVHWSVSKPTPIEDFKWSDLRAEGETNMGKAMAMVAEQLKMPPMPDRALRPVLVLVSDGQPTDDFSAGLKSLMDQRWGQKAVRIAIAIGQDADTDVLQKFIGDAERKPLQANNPEQLTKYIKWVSTDLITEVSQPPSERVKGDDSSTENVFIPKMDNGPTNAVDVW